MGIRKEGDLGDEIATASPAGREGSGGLRTALLVHWLRVNAFLIALAVAALLVAASGLSAPRWRMALLGLGLAIRPFTSWVHLVSGWPAGRVRAWDAIARLLRVFFVLYCLYLILDNIPAF